MQQDFTGLYIMLFGVMALAGLFAFLTREDKPKAKSSKRK
jgi:hypothetical protein